MSRTCQICGRGPLTRIRRSHSNIATKRRQYLNLQWVQKEGKRIKACAKCIKSLHKTK